MTNNSDFTYFNKNPLGLKEQDCVIRAISLATGKDYLSVINLLENTQANFHCEALCVCCYSYLLDEYFGFSKVPCSSMTAKEFKRKHPYGIFLIRMDGHLSCLINGKIYDIWDCSDEILTDVWKIDS